jgi:hypothetical protein
MSRALATAFPVLSMKKIARIISLRSRLFREAIDDDDRVIRDTESSTRPRKRQVD